MIHLLFFLSLITGAFAKLDLTMGVQGRTLPTLGAEAYAESGYNMVWWGKKKNPKDVLYGLIRPSLAVTSSGVINAVKGELEFFPISFLGVAVGRQYTNSNFDFPFFDCEEVTCKGEFIRNYVEGKMVLGFKGWIAMGSYKIDTVRSPDRDVDQADWRHVIIGDPGEDTQEEKKLLIGKVFSNKLIGVLAERARFEGSGNMKESFAAVYQVRYGKTNYMIGAGAFRSDQEPMGLIFYFRLHHLAVPSLKLF